MNQSQPQDAEVRALRERARKHMDRGAVTENYGADLQAVLHGLDTALATELVCVLRYKRHYFMAKGIRADIVAREFLEHAQQEQEHADQICARIVQLGGEPDLSPDTLLARSHSQYVIGTSLKEMIEENLIAERIAIESYGELIRFIGTGDPTTRNMLEEILAVEEEHADDMAGLLEDTRA